MIWPLRRWKKIVYYVTDMRGRDDIPVGRTHSPEYVSRRRRIRIIFRRRGLFGSRIVEWVSGTDPEAL